VIDPGSVAIGALCIIALMAGFVGWVTRGHRWDLTGVRIVATRDPLEPLRRASAVTRQPEDFYEMAKDRGGE
jgi:hypothetical protein